MGDQRRPEDDDGGLVERLSGKGAKELVRQLVRRIPTGQDPAQRERLSRAAARAENLPPELSAGYDAALEQAGEFARRLQLLPANERQRFSKALGLLKSGNGVLGLASDTKGMLLDGLGVYEALLTRSWTVRYDDPREMCHLARVAVEVADRLDAADYGPAKVADYQARAWGELANAYRVANRYGEAEETFGRAFVLVKKGTGDRRLLMRLLDLEASLLGTLREFALALDRLTLLAELHRETGDLHLAGRTLTKKALYTFYSGRAEEASRTIIEGLALIDAAREPSLLLVAAFNQLLILVDCGHIRDAQIALFKHRARLTGGGRAANLKLRWIEGRIWYGSGKLESAETTFREVKEGFEKAGLGFACALAGLDLAITFMRQGRAEESRAEALEAAAMFQSLSIHREVLGTVIIIEEAVRSKKATLTVLENAARYLRKKQMEHGLS